MPDSEGTLPVSILHWPVALGSLITSSNTASNVLFAPLQITAAQAEGIAPEIVVVSQTAGAATGQAVSPGDALLGATVVCRAESLGEILRITLPWTVLTSLLIAGTTLILYFLS
ncbi:MAG: L-lactate permease [Dehalococcoidales bacterium]|nr:L-lactate permease [Dehalococcoidales bacterium]